MSGWIKLHRQFTEWEWYDDDKCFRLFIHLLLKANHKDKKWRGMDVNRGEYITSISNLSSETGMSQQTIRTVLKKLESTSEISKKSTSKLTKITICKYSNYQDEEKETNKRTTNEQQTTNNQLTTTKECKNEKNEKNCYGETFLKFWEFYGKKGNKAKAYKQWQKLKIDQIEEIKHNLKSYIESTPDKQYRKNAEVYLNPANEHWNDEVISKEQKEKDNSFLKVSTKRTGVFA